MPPHPSWTHSHASPSADAGRQPHLPAGRGVPHGVGQQVAQHAGELGVAAEHGRPARRAPSADHRDPGARRPPRPRRRPRRSTTSPSASRVGRSRSAPDVARDSWKRSSTMPAIRSVSRRIRSRYSADLGRVGGPRRRPARRPCRGSRPAGSAGRGSSRRPAPGGTPRRAARPPGPPAARAPRGPSAGPSSTPPAPSPRRPPGTTAIVPTSCGVYMNPLTPTTPTSAAASGTSTSAVIAAVTDRRRIRCSRQPADHARPAARTAAPAAPPAPARRATFIRPDPARVVAVAGAPDRGDPPRPGRVGLDLLPQPPHVHGHRGLVAELPAPHLGQQLGPGVGAAGVGEQEGEQVELAGGQRQLACRPGCARRAAGSTPQVAVDEQARRRARPAAARRSTEPTRSTSSRGLNGLVT